MRIPKRRGEEARKMNDPGNSPLLTAEAVESLRRELKRLEEHQRPKAMEDLRAAQAMGDLSENAAYSEAKGRLLRINELILTCRDRLKRAVIIEPGTASDGSARLGSAVTVEVNGRIKEYQLTGPQESDPSRGRISHVSPLGKALLGHKAGERIEVQGPTGTVAYSIKAVR